ncbi:MAG: chorismate synthase [Flavobacterium sp.]|nr:chorismate synthase [Flavobacterium sp.]
MAGNTFGTLLKLTTFGESHGEAIGGILDGIPAGVELDLQAIQYDLSRRRPGQSSLVSPRDESDTLRILSGVFEGKTTGAPLGFLIPNTNTNSADYAHLANSFRPSHADFTYEKKYGLRDYRGGGRSSARETAIRVVAGAIAKQLLPHISIQAYVSSVGHLTLTKSYTELDLSATESSAVRCPDQAVAQEMETYIRTVQAAGDTVGGIITCVIKGVPAGLGEPVFDKLHAELGKAMLSINAVKGFELGSGFAGSSRLGSEHNDVFLPNGSTQTNHSGGVQGGISNGMDIYFRVAFKPVATLMQDQQSVNKKGEAITIQGKGRHDACVVPRAVPIVEAMAALVLADFAFRQRAIANWV